MVSFDNSWARAAFAARPPQTRSFLDAVDDLEASCDLAERTHIHDLCKRRIKLLRYEQELSDAAANPGRLSDKHSRPGQALHEQRMRVALQSLPALNKTIETLVVAWQEENGQAPLEFEGVEILTMLRAQDITEEAAPAEPPQQPPSQPLTSTAGNRQSAAKRTVPPAAKQAHRTTSEAAKVAASAAADLQLSSQMEALVTGAAHATAADPMLASRWRELGALLHSLRLLDERAVLQAAAPAAPTELMQPLQLSWSQARALWPHAEHSLGALGAEAFGHHLLALGARIAKCGEQLAGSLSTGPTGSSTNSSHV